MFSRFYIALFFVFGTTFLFSQTTEQSIEEVLQSLQNENELTEVDEENYDNDFDPQQDYLSTPIEKKQFDRETWERIKRRVIDDYVDEEGEYDTDSPYGKQKIKDEDNPYQKSEQNYRKYWDEKQKNSKEVKTRPVKRSPESQSSRSNLPTGGVSLSPVFGQILLVVVVLILVGLIFYLFFKAPVEKQSKKITQDINEISPTEIPKSELELMLEKALANEDYREAIRIYFIFILRALSQKQWINWEKEKTNFSYLIEMRKNNHYNDFEKTVSIYEIIWYGKRTLSKQSYLEIEPVFKALTHELEK